MVYKVIPQAEPVTGWCEAASCTDLSCNELLSLLFSLAFGSSFQGIYLPVLSIRFEEGGYIGKAPARDYSIKTFLSCNPIISIWNKLASIRVFGVKLL